MCPSKHWEGVYERKRADEVSWYRPHLEQSLGFIDGAGLDHDARIIDVGGGASTLVDDLLGRGYSNVTVLDLSETALKAAKARLGHDAARVRWLVADITEVGLEPRFYDFWHDRAVFHFLRDAELRRRYVAALRRFAKPGGYVLIATFGPEGPTKCSGLDVCRYTADQLEVLLGPEFTKIASATEVHRTPGGTKQQFIYYLCRMVPRG